MFNEFKGKVDIDSVCLSKLCGYRSVIICKENTRTQLKERVAEMKLSIEVQITGLPKACKI